MNKAEREFLALYELEAQDLAIDNLAAFARYVWPILEPGTPFRWNWHLDIIFGALQKQLEGDTTYRKILICIPPGMMKSLSVAVIKPAWAWLREPTRRVLSFANSDRLATRDSRKMRNIIDSVEYQALVAQQEKRGVRSWGLTKDQNEKVSFENTMRGFRECLAIGSRVTGRRADEILLDDLLDAKATVHGSMEQVARRLLEVNETVEKVLPSRVNDMQTACWTMIMQRLHQGDPAGRALKRGGWHVINLQMEFDPNNPLNHPDDPRTRKGELLFPAMFPAAVVADLRESLQSEYYAQYQQDPRPAEGGVLKKHYWRFWYPATWAEAPPPVMVKMPDGSMHECAQLALPETFDEQAQSWDCAFKDLRTSDYVAGQAWGKAAANMFLLDYLLERLDINGTLDAVEMFTERWPGAIKKLVEDKANGTAVIGLLTGKIQGMIAVEPRGGKEVRVNAAAPFVRAGNVILPHPHVAPWVLGFIERCAAFPFVDYDDDIDAATQMINDWALQPKRYVSWEDETLDEKPRAQEDLPGALLYD